MLPPHHPVARPIHSNTPKRVAPRPVTRTARELKSALRVLGGERKDRRMPAQKKRGSSC